MKKIHNLLFVFFLMSYSVVAQTTTFTPTVIDISASEILNPSRGFFRWNGEEVAPYPSIDRYKRYKWNDIETSQGVYNFSALDAEAAAAASDPNGKGKFSFGIRCVVEGSTRSYPTYLDGLMTSWYSTAKSCWVPDWNDVDFLTRLAALMDTLGARYNYDPRIGYIEIRTYGNWGEWHMTGFETTPPTRPASVQNITNSSVYSIIDSHVNAFPNKQIIMMTDNNIGLTYALSKTGLNHPIGWRRDSWCYDPTFSIIKSQSSWTTGGGSTRWQTAPVVLEGYGGTKMKSNIGYQEVIDYHGSAIGNGNFNTTWSSMTQGCKDTMLFCAKTSGYRYIIRSVTFPTAIIPGQNATFITGWSNVGVAPLYEDRDVTYRISNISTGAIVWSGKSTIILRGFLPTYNYSTQVDTPVTINDSFSIPTGIVQGTYNLDVLVSDPIGYSNPLNLAITGQKTDGAYSLGTIEISASYPDAPTSIVATGGNAQVSVAFTAPTNNGGSAITSYTATSSPEGKTGTVNQSGSGTITITNLTNGTAYTFTVIATNTIGNSVASSASNSVTPVTVPGVPTNIVATAGNAQALVAFVAPTNNGGSTITSYTATSSSGGKTGILTQAGSGTITVLGLTNGTAYTFTVVATNAQGNSVSSSVSASVTPATVPTAPTGIVAIAGNAQASVAFNTPNNGGSPITSYTVYKYINAVKINPGVTGSSSPIVVTGLTNGTAYTFRVVATNAIGNSNYSSASNSVTPSSQLGVRGEITDILSTDDNTKPIISTLNGKLKLCNLIQYASVKVYNSIGQLIESKISDSNEMEIKLSENQIYIINISIENGNWVFKYLN